MNKLYFFALALFLTVSAVTDTQAQFCTGSTSRTNATCNGICDGTATANASFFRPAPFTYLWSNGATTQTVTGLCAGTYTVSITDGNNCTSNHTVTITQPSAISATTTQTNPICYGAATGTATITVSGGGTYTYSWNTSPVQTTQTATGLTAGTYTVTATNTGSGCPVIRTVTITQPPDITGSISTTPADCGQSNGTATANGSGGTGTLTYSWSNGQTGATATGLAAGNYILTVTDANGCTKTAPIIITNAGGPTLTIEATDVTCSGGNNGTATVTGTGGTEPYTYSWNTNPVQTTQTAVGLEAGTYTVIVTDAQSCFTSISVTVGEQNSMAVTTTHINVSCNGGATGSATATATGGIGPYYYLWNTSPSQNGPTAHNLTIGTYTVTAIDAFSCSATATVTITQSDVLISQTVHTNLSCYGANDGTATVNVFGGNQPYHFSWNSNPIQTTQTATNLPAGNYTVVVTDTTNCTTTAGVSITQPPAITVTATATTTSCGQTGGSATASASGGTGVLTYSWDTNPVQTTATATGLSAGTYTVTVTDESDCSVTASATVTSPGGPSSTVTHTNVSCHGGNNGTASVVASGGSQPYTYAWTGGQTTATAFGLTAGTYTITVTDQANCTTISTVIITEPQELEVSISSTDVLCNGLSSGSATATVTGGVAGYTYSWDTQPEETTAAITGLDAGAYTVTVTDNNGCEATASASVSEPDQLTAATIQTHVSCFGGNNGAATVNPTGGTQPYSYSWTGGQTTQTAIGLVSANYTVTVTDTNGCVTTQQVAITEPDLITTNYTTVPEDCGQSNGSIAVTVEGGAGNYTYSWNTNPEQTTATATALASGTYTLTVTDENGCTNSLTVSLPNAGGLNAESTSTNVSCNGGANGTATLNASGGTQPYTYAWNTNPVETTQSVTGLEAGTYTGTITDDVGCVFTVNVTITEPEALTVSATDQDILCNGQATGIATANVAGGTVPYSYSWDTTPEQTTDEITGLIAGTYTVAVTDANGCEASATVNITQPASPLTATAVHTNVSCNGGSNGAGTANPSGGTSPYTYVWNTIPTQTTQTAFGLPAGTYTVVITDANGCSISKNTTITQPAAITTSATTVNAACGQSTGSATVTASGGAGNFTYSWNTTPEQTTATASALEAGVYTVIVTDGNNCTATETVTVNNENAAQLSINSNNSSCFEADNGTATVTATGGTGNLSYSWNTSPAQTTATATGLAPGDYTVTVTDQNGCESFESVTITEPTEIVVTVTGTDPSCIGCSDGSATATVSGGISPYTYSWSSGQTTASINNLPEGQYCVFVTDANGCDVVSCVTLTDPPTGIINASLSENTFTVYPNPTSGTVTVELETAQLTRITLTLTNMLGQNIVNKQSEVNGLFKQSFDLSDFAEGLYFITVRSENETLLRKVIKK